MTAPSKLTVSLTWDEVKAFNGALAELSIAVKETKVIVQDEGPAERLDKAQKLANAWDAIFRKRDELARAEAEVAK